MHFETAQRKPVAFRAAVFFVGSAGDPHVEEFPNAAKATDYAHNVTRDGICISEYDETKQLVRATHHPVGMIEAVVVERIDEDAAAEAQREEDFKVVSDSKLHPETEVTPITEPRKC